MEYTFPEFPFRLLLVQYFAKLELIMVDKQTVICERHAKKRLGLFPLQDMLARPSFPGSSMHVLRNNTHDVNNTQDVNNTHDVNNTT